MTRKAMTPHSPSKLSFSLKMTILSLLAASILSGCGIRGTLKTPPPLFGEDAKVDPERVPNEDLDADDEDDLGLIDEDPLEDV